MAHTPTYRVGDWLVTPELNLLERNGQTVRLEPQAMDLLLQLIVRAPEVVSTEDLAHEVWKGRAIGDGQIYRRIAEIRSAFGDDSREPRYVETIPKRGYRLAAPVEPLLKPSIVGTLLTRRWQRVAALAALVTLAAISGVVLLRSDNDDPGAAMVIAVLPFANTSEAAAQNYLGESIADELIHALSNAPGLTVVARTSSFSFANTNSDIAEISEQLGVSLVLEGSARRRAGQLQVTAQLVDSVTSHVLWSEAFDQPLADLITVERDIALAVAAHVLGPNVDTQRITAALPPLTNVSAYEYYLLGRQRMASGFAASMRNWSPADADQAVAYFRRAIAADPEFARAYTGLADALLHRAAIGQGSSRAFENGIPMDIADEATSAIDRALALEPDLADARVSRGLAIRLLEGDQMRALELYREAIALNPNLVEAHYALGRARTGEEAAAAMLKAAELAPMSADIHLWTARALSERGDDAASLRHYERAAELENPPGSALLIVADQHREAGRPDEAIRLLRPYLGREAYAYDDDRIRARLSSFYLDLGASETARQLLGAREPGEPQEIANARLHLAIAEGNDDLVADILHERTPYEVDSLYALYEQVIGHDDHARAQFAASARVEEEAGSPANEFSPWGFAPALNRALLAIDAGDAARAVELLDLARQIVSEKLDRYPSTSGAYYVLAGIEAVNGDTAAALDRLEQAAAAGWTKHWYLQRDPNLRSLRDEPRFHELIARIRSDMTRLRLELQDEPPPP